MDIKSLGRCGENSAVLYLESHGYHIIERNLHIGRAEIDIIAENDDFVVFAEVKTRRQVPGFSGRYGSPAEAVDAKKRALLIGAADAYLAGCGHDKAPRIDVIEVYVDPKADEYRVVDIRHIENAVRKSGKFSRKY